MRKNADIPKWDVLPQLNPVHQSPTTPYLFYMWKHADIPKWDVSSLIKTSASEPYYTMSIWHVEACRHTQMRCIPPNLSPVLQSPTTPCPFDMWKHADIPKWDVSPLMKPSASEPYYTMSIWHVEACRHTQMRCIPPNWSQCFIALLHHAHLTCGSM